MPLQEYPKPTLPRLPLEIICDVLGELDNIKQLLAIVRSAPLFLRAWVWGSRSITTQILTKRGHNYGDARELADVQILFPTPARQYSSTRLIVTNVRLLDNTLSTLKLMAGNARAVDLACRYFVGGLAFGGEHELSKQPQRSHLPLLTPSERHRFIHAYYRAWTFATSSRGTRTHLGNSPTDWQSQFLAKTSPRELWRIREMLFYVRRELPSEIRIALHIEPSASHSQMQTFFSYYASQAGFRAVVGRPFYEQYRLVYDPAMVERRRAKYPWDDALLALSLSPQRLHSVPLIAGYILGLEGIFPNTQPGLQSKILHSGIFDEDQKFLEILSDKSADITPEDARRKLQANVEYTVKNIGRSFLEEKAPAATCLELWREMGQGSHHIIPREHCRLTHKILKVWGEILGTIPTMPECR